MRVRLSSVFLFAFLLLVFVLPLLAQDLGPEFRKIKDGIYVESTAEANSNIGVILTDDGVVLVDSGFNPTDSRLVLSAVKKLTPLPIRFLIDSETHPDHTSYHFVFSPPAVVIAGEGTSDHQDCKRELADPLDRRKVRCDCRGRGAVWLPR